MNLNARIKADVATNLKAINTAKEQMDRAARLLTDIQGLQYERGTRDIINLWAKSFSNDVKNAWAKIVKRSLKRDLVETLKIAGESIIRDNQIEIVTRAQEIQNLEGAIITEQKRRNVKSLLSEMKKQEVAFVSKFENASDGMMLYRAVTQLVESNYLGKSDLVKFGFVL